MYSVCQENQDLFICVLEPEPSRHCVAWYPRISLGFNYHGPLDTFLSLGQTTVRATDSETDGGMGDASEGAKGGGRPPQDISNNCNTSRSRKHQWVISKDTYIGRKEPWVGKELHLYRRRESQSQ